MPNARHLIQDAIHQFQGRRFHSAEILCRQVIDHDRNCPDAWHLLGMIADAAGKSDDAIELIRHALNMAPERADFHNNLGTIHEQRGDLNLAALALEEAIRIAPDYAIAHNNLGEVMKDYGRVRDAVTAYRAALRLAPDFVQAGSNLLMTLNYDPDTDCAKVAEAHRRWGQSVEQRIVPLPAATNTPDPYRPLRVGYVSPDFRKHAVARFFEPVLTAHDREQFEVYLYAESPVVDQVSQRLRTLAAGWRSTFQSDSASVAHQARSDGIDILIDLAGHTRNNRLEIFAYKPAPVQVTYLGYPNSTGLSSVDYRISDAVIDPPDQPWHGPEKICRLPGHAYCLMPPENAPDPLPPPSEAHGFVTFGSHHPPIKLNDRVLTLWAQVLKTVRSSRILLFRNSFNRDVTNELKDRLARCGVPLNRVDFRCPTIDEPSYLAMFRDIDIVLDSFPFNGHTMTCEALWMGVPVVTRRGDRPSGRLCASVLQALGIHELIAESDDEYVTRAAEWAAATIQRRELRTQLRQLMKSRLCDAGAFTRCLESGYRWMWRQWCATCRSSGGIHP